MIELEWLTINDPSEEKSLFFLLASMGAFLFFFFDFFYFLYCSGFCHTLK